MLTSALALVGRGRMPLLILEPQDMCGLLCSTDAVTRITEGLASLMLSLRRRFTVRCPLPFSGFACTHAIGLQAKTITT